MTSYRSFPPVGPCSDRVASADLPRRRAMIRRVGARCCSEVRGAWLSADGHARGHQQMATGRQRPAVHAGHGSTGPRPRRSPGEACIREASVAPASAASCTMRSPRRGRLEVHGERRERAHIAKPFAQFIAVCRRSKWSKHLTNSPCLALLAMAGSSAACKISSACSKAFC
jgi:hypothetical protein